MSTKGKKPDVLNALVKVSTKIAANVYVRALRDGIATLLPLFMLSSVASLFSGLIFTDKGMLSGFVSAETLASLRNMCTMILNATSNVVTLMVGITVAYYVGKYKKFENPVACSVMTLIMLVIFMPTTLSVKVGENSGTVNNMLSFSYTGTQGMFLAMLVGVLGSVLFIKMSQNKHLQIKMPAGVPEAMVQSFNSLIPVVLLGLGTGVVSWIISSFSLSLYDLIRKLIQAPLTNLVTGLPGYLFVFGLSQLLFSLGVHASVINSVALRPFLTMTYNENVLAFAANEPIPNIISNAFQNYVARMGGAGCLLALLVAIFIVGRKKQTKSIAKMALVPAIFNIGEPIIFGLPIMLNPIMMIPFVIAPLVAASISYLMTFIGFVAPLAIDTPNTTPVLISGFIAGAGDIKVCIVQLISFIACVLIYIPFVKAYERTLPDEGAMEE